MGDADDLAVHDPGIGPKLMQRSVFSVELAERVAREKLELALKANAHAAKDLRRLAAKSAGCAALPPAVKRVSRNDFALKRHQLTSKQQILEAFILKMKGLKTQVEDSQSGEEKEGMLEVLRLMLKTTPSLMPSVKGGTS
ncbi:hypothetical protein B0H14DRAFT_3429604 [Mycena olivaceomarginata]|nr:hypothetical protein B0H14DRAFT_3429604 [Mycena olivaceomarginata]